MSPATGILKAKLETSPEYKVLLENSTDSTESAVERNLRVYLQLQDEVFRAGGMSAAMSEVLQSVSVSRMRL